MPLGDVGNTWGERFHARRICLQSMSQYRKSQLKMAEAGLRLLQVRLHGGHQLLQLRAGQGDLLCVVCCCLCVCCVVVILMLFSFDAV